MDFGSDSFIEYERQGISKGVLRLCALRETANTLLLSASNLAAFCCVCSLNHSLAAIECCSPLLVKHDASKLHLIDVRLVAMFLHVHAVCKCSS